MKYNPKIHKRRSIRLAGYDYSQEGLYFITICCQNRASLFGEIVEGEMQLNAFGTIAEQEWLNTPNVRKNIGLHDFIIMPNHIHGIIEIIESKGEKSKEETGKGDKSKGELQFAPTDLIAATTISEFRSPSQTIGSIIRGYKIATIKKIKDYILSEKEDKKSKEDKSKGCMSKDEKSKRDKSKGELRFAPTAPTDLIALTIEDLDYKIWQRNYYEHIIRDTKAYDNISNYIINNPIKWEEDKFFKK